MPIFHPSPFLSIQIPTLLDRFSISYEQDASCIEYFLFAKESIRPLSRSLILSHEIFTGSLYVSRFYPEIYRELNCKYLSAACFYMIVHHAVFLFRLSDGCRVNLETDTGVFETFYSRLDDFHFQVCHARPARRVYIRGIYRLTEVDPGMIRPVSGKSYFFNKIY